MSFVLVPGAWAESWVWDRVAACLTRRGHDVFQLTLSGLDNGDGRPATTGLRSHIAELTTYLEPHPRDSVVLVGHSYSGVVVGQVATHSLAQIKHTVFVEAFLPVDGKSLLDISGLDVVQETKQIDENNGYWPAPTLEELKSQPKLAAEDIELLHSRHKNHPGRTVTDPAALGHSLSTLEATFISEEGWLNGSQEASLMGSLKDQPSWRFQNISGGHWPMLSVPDQLASMLHEVCA